MLERVIMRASDLNEIKVNAAELLDGTERYNGYCVMAACNGDYLPLRVLPASDVNQHIARGLNPLSPERSQFRDAIEKMSVIPYHYAGDITQQIGDMLLPVVLRNHFDTHGRIKYFLVITPSTHHLYTRDSQPLGGNPGANAVTSRLHVIEDLGEAGVFVRAMQRDLDRIMAELDQTSGRAKRLVEATGYRVNSYLLQ